ncbi:MAG TPA: hypothetical protein VMC79_16890 [Rectinemataceae bacterium]|nr:hypothetical protein [Rectinemataceae bacterium]
MDRETDSRDAREIQARSLRRAFGRRLIYVVLNSLAAYIPLYLISSFAARSRVAIDARILAFTGLLVAFILAAGSLLILIEYLTVLILMNRAWKGAPEDAVCFARILEYRESYIRKRSCLIGKDAEGLYALRGGKRRRLCGTHYAVSVHEKLGAYAPFFLGKVKLRPYLQIHASLELYMVDAISPEVMAGRLKWSGEHRSDDSKEVGQ